MATLRVGLVDGVKRLIQGLNALEIVWSGSKCPYLAAGTDDHRFSDNYRIMAQISDGALRKVSSALLKGVSDCRSSQR